MSAVIISKIVQPGNRLAFLPKHCGVFHLNFELGVYSIMDRACASYSGGLWDFFELSNGGFYIALDSAQAVHLIWPDNYFDASMSADAAGIGVSLMVLSNLSFQKDSARFAEKFHLLRDFALEHDEASLIFRFID